MHRRVKIEHTHTHTHTHTHSSLGSPGLVLPPQVVDVDDESGFVLADHVPDFALVNSLVLLQNMNIVFY